MARVAVVGAGAIGLASGYALARRGHEVVIIDRGEPGAACTRGNAGWVTPSISGPIPAPGLTWTSLKWMFRSDSPLYISPTAAPGLARWLWRFWRHCNRRDFLAGLAAVAEINRGTLKAFDDLARDGLHFELHRDGLLFVFLDPKYMEHVRAEFTHYADYGYEVPEPMDGAALRQLEPALSSRVRAGFFVDAEYHVRPETLAAGYARRLVEMGAEVRTGVDVVDGIVSGGRLTALETSAGPLVADEFLVAAGAWTGQVLGRFGPRLPVEAGKGYSITANGTGPSFSRPVYLGEARIGCTPFEGAHRYAGTMELSGINEVLDHRRVRGVRKGIRDYFHEPLPDDEGEEWVGMRPLTPDGLPMLGRVPGIGNLSVATGHAMLGITMAPVTGELMADLIEGRPGSALAPFEPGRFRW